MNDAAGPSIESVAAAYAERCESCGFWSCKGDCELVRADAAIKAILAEQAAFAAAERSVVTDLPCCSLKNGEHDLHCEYAFECDCVEINDRVMLCGSCREGAL
jgi:hypothetical protein